VCLDTSRAAELLGWTAEIALEQGLQRTIDWYRSSLASTAP
jgi:GDP-L-fucose synthase